MSLFAELKRRNVIRAGAAYLAISWLLIQIVETLLPLFDISDVEAALETFLIADTLPFVVLQGKALAFWTLGRTAEYEAALADVQVIKLKSCFRDRVSSPPLGKAHGRGA